MTVKIITKNQEEELLKTPTKTKWNLMYSLMIHAGLRVGEVVQLRRSDFWVNEIVNTRLKVRAEITETKTDRIVPLVSYTIGTLKKYAEDFSDLEIANPDGYLFPGKTKDGHVGVRGVQESLEAHSVRAFGQKINPHMLRHTYATRLAKVTNLKTVQMLLGHKFLRSTQVYTHPDITDLDKAVEQL